MSYGPSMEPVHSAAGPGEEAEAWEEEEEQGARLVESAVEACRKSLSAEADMRRVINI